MKTIAFSSIRLADEYTLPFRIVLRDTGRELVTHMETCPFNVTSYHGEIIHGFHHGHYFSYGNEANAIADFRLRTSEAKLDIAFDSGVLSDFCNIE